MAQILDGEELRPDRFLRIEPIPLFGDETVLAEMALGDMAVNTIVFPAGTLVVERCEINGHMGLPELFAALVQGVDGTEKGLGIAKIHQEAVMHSDGSEFWHVGDNTRDRRNGQPRLGMED